MTTISVFSSRAKRRLKLIAPSQPREILGYLVSHLRETPLSMAPNILAVQVREAVRYEPTPPTKTE
jgi:hypothetical protein